MANRLAIDHEEGLFLPDYSTAPNADGELIYKLGTPPADSSNRVGKYALHAAAVTTTNPVGPKVTFEEVLPNEIYGSFMIYPVGGVNYINYRWHARGYNSVDNFGNPTGSPTFALILIPSGSMDSNWKTTGTCTVRIAAGADATGTSSNANRAAASILVPFGAWTQVDFHIVYGQQGYVEIAQNCGTYAKGGIVDNSAYGGVKMIDWSMSYGFLQNDGLRDYWLDNIVINDTVGAFNNGKPCLDPFPGTGFSGVESEGFTVAPEKLPHSITVEDTKGDRTLARKLQENFDSIERQLLALDPDNQNSSNPIR